MSLLEPTKKMSKSDHRPKSRILITDSRDEIHKKLNAARTDSLNNVTYDRTNRPGVSNLVDLIFHFDQAGAASPEDLASDMKGLSMRALKERAADTVDAGIRDTRERYNEIMGGDPNRVFEQADGAPRARAIAGQTMRRVRTAMGISE
jgi:tryptophanyl-tRNA synthetase